MVGTLPVDYVDDRIGHQGGAGSRISTVGKQLRMSSRPE